MPKSNAETSTQTGVVVVVVVKPVHRNVSQHLERNAIKLGSPVLNRASITELVSPDSLRMTKSHTPFTVVVGVGWEAGQIPTSRAR